MPVHRTMAGENTPTAFGAMSRNELPAYEESSC